MRHIKKVLALVLVLMLTASMIGCSSKDKKDDKKQGAETSQTEDVKEHDKTIANVTAPDTTAAVEVTDTPEPTSVPDEAEIPDKPDDEVDEVEPDGGVSNVGFTVDKETLIKAYYEFLMEFMDNHLDDEFYTYRFYMGNVDADDIPELFLISGDYHPCGVQVFKYLEDGTIAYVGEYGEFGSFIYDDKANMIFSTYVGMGYFDTTIATIGPSGEEIILANFSEYTEGDDSDTLYYLEGEETTEEAYTAEFEKYYTSDYSNPRNLVYVNYSDTVSYYDSCYSDRCAILGELYDAVQASEPFKGYFPEEARRLVGFWELESIEATRADKGIYGESFGYGSADATFEMTEDYTASFFFYPYADGLGEGIAEVDAPLFYYDTSIYDGDMADFCVKMQGSYDYPDNRYYFNSFIDRDGTEKLQLCVYTFVGEDEPDDILKLYFTRKFMPSGEAKFGELTRLSESDTDDLYAYNFVEYIWITYDASDELKAEYGYAPDLDGYDYMLDIKHDTEPRVVYGTKELGWENTHYYRQDFGLFSYNETDAENFNMLMGDDGDYPFFVRIYFDDETGLCSYVAPEYTG